MVISFKDILQLLYYVHFVNCVLDLVVFLTINENNNHDKSGDNAYDCIAVLVMERYIFVTELKS